MLMDTFCRFMQVRGAHLGHISDSTWSKIRRQRTKDVRHSDTKACKPLI
jgi:hypothetical protein